MAKKIRMTVFTLLVCLMVSTAAIGLGACNDSSGNNTDQNAYTLSFDANGGSAVDSLTVEEGKAVTLPVSEKTNYAFCGWYFDNGTFNDKANGTTLKYLSAKSDLTVYAKWEELDLTKDGIYGVSFDVSITDSIVLDDAPEGFKPTFSDNLDKEESGLSIINGKKYLDLVVYGSEDFGFFQGGMRYKVTYNDTELSVYTGDARVNSMDMASENGRRQFRLPIDSDADSVVLSIKELETGDNVYATVECATYNVIVKFSDVTYKAYAEKSDTLEDGIYTVDTHALSVKDGSVSMNENFNDVRTYIKVENGKMKMYKTFKSYMGMTGKSGKEAYYDTLATYTGYSFVTPVANVWNYDGSFNEDYIEKDLVAVETWFNAQSGLYTYSWDISDWKDSYIITGTVTGFMLEAMGMASTETLLGVDIDTLIKTDDVILPVKPTGTETKWTTLATGNLTSTNETMKETWAVNFFWQGDMDGDLSARTMLSYVSNAVPRIDAESGEVYADVEYTIYNTAANRDIYGDAVKVELQYGEGNNYNTGARQNVLITSEKPTDKQVDIALSQESWLEGKTFDANREMNVEWLVGETYEYPEAYITVDGFEYSLMKADSSSGTTLVAGAGYKMYASADNENWLNKSLSSSNRTINRLIGSEAYKYYRMEFRIKDQYGEYVCYKINITVQDLDIEWGLAAGDNSGVSLEDCGVLIKANAGDVVNVPKYTYKVNGQEKPVAVTAYLYTADKRTLIADYENGKAITVSDDAYFIQITYTGKYLNTTADQSRYVYITVNGKLDIGEITAADSVEKGNKAYFINPIVKIDGKQVAAKLICKAYGWNGLSTSYNLRSVANETDNNGRNYVVAGEYSEIYLCVQITCGKIAGDGSALGYNWNVTLDAISRIIVNQSVD